MEDEDVFVGTLFGVLDSDEAFFFIVMEDTNSSSLFFCPCFFCRNFNTSGGI